MIKEIIELKNLELFKLFSYLNISKEIIIDCFSENNIEKIKFIIQDDKLNLPEEIVKNISLDILLLLNEKQLFNQLAIFKTKKENYNYFIKNNLLDKNNPRIFLEAVKLYLNTNNVELISTIKYLIDQKYKIEATYITQIIEEYDDNIDFEFIKLLVENKFKIDEDLIIFSSDNEKIFKYLVENYNNKKQLFSIEAQKYTTNNCCPKIIINFIDLGFISLDFIKSKNLNVYCDILEYKLKNN